MIKREKLEKTRKKWRLASLAASGGGGGGSEALGRGVGGVVPPPPPPLLAMPAMDCLAFERSVMIFLTRGYYMKNLIFVATGFIFSYEIYFSSYIILIFLRNILYGDFLC